MPPVGIGVRMNQWNSVAVFVVEVVVGSSIHLENSFDVDVGEWALSDNTAAVVHSQDVVPGDDDDNTYDVGMVAVEMTLLLDTSLKVVVILPGVAVSKVPNQLSSTMEVQMVP